MHFEVSQIFRSTCISHSSMHVDMHVIYNASHPQIYQDLVSKLTIFTIIDQVTVFTEGLIYKMYNPLITQAKVIQ